MDAVTLKPLQNAAGAPEHTVSTRVRLFLLRFVRRYWSLNLPRAKRMFRKAELLSPWTAWTPFLAKRSDQLEQEGNRVLGMLKEELIAWSLNGRLGNLSRDLEKRK